MFQSGDSCLLLVEDDSNDILLIQKAFENTNVGNDVRIVKDGDAAIAYLCGEGQYADRNKYPLPVLILLDLKLPRRSGKEVLAWIRQQPGIKRIPVIVLTSSSQHADVDFSYDLGVNSYLVKPVGFEKLSEMIAAVDAYWLRLNEYPSVVLAE